MEVLVHSNPLPNFVGHIPFSVSSGTNLPLVSMVSDCECVCVCVCVLSPRSLAGHPASLSLRRELRAYVD